MLVYVLTLDVSDRGGQWKIEGRPQPYHRLDGVYPTIEAAYAEMIVQLKRYAFMGTAASATVTEYEMGRNYAKNSWTTDDPGTTLDDLLFEEDLDE